VALLSDVAVILYSSISVLTLYGNFWDVPLLHLVSDLTVRISMKILFLFGAICRLTKLPEWAIIYYKSQESGVCRSGMN
jgi:hypothetical protein